MEEKIREIQRILGVTVDGKWGPKSQAAFDLVIDPTTSKRLVGDGTWPWFAEIEGGDIVIRRALVTAFGGASDNMDSGETASGLNTARNPGFIGCALPMRRDAASVLRGSPIPKLPYLTTEVRFTDPKTGASVNTKLIDEGPAKWTGHGGDLTVAAARVFDPQATANRFKRVLDIRIIDGVRLAGLKK